LNKLLFKNLATDRLFHSWAWKEVAFSRDENIFLSVLRLDLIFSVGLDKKPHLVSGAFVWYW